MSSDIFSETQSSLDNELNQSQLVINHLSDIVNDYLVKHSRMTLNGLSKKCQVSEPTIRRIAKRQIKTLPNLSTVLDLLTTISKKNEISELLKLYSGPVAEFVKEAMPYAQEQGSEFSVKIHGHLKDPVKYIIFKLSLNSIGISENKIKKLFGELGVNDLKYLVKHELIELKGDVFQAKVNNFTTAFEDFVDQFKASANFIKPHTYQSRMPMNPLFINASDSVSVEAYKEISKVQRAAFKKISQIMSDDKTRGCIPIVYLCALDTIDTESAYEIAKKNGVLN